VVVFCFQLLSGWFAAVVLFVSVCFSCLLLPFVFGFG
jgi:hypothetical protein